MQASSFEKCENELDEIRKGTYLALQQRQGPDAERLLGKEMTSFFMTSVYLQLLINILCQERMGGEEQHLFLCFEALEIDSCYGKHPCKFQQPHAPRKHGASRRAPWQIMLWCHTGYQYPEALKH